MRSVRVLEGLPLAAVLLLAGAASGQARMVDTTPGAGATAIVGGRLLTISHGTIENGVIVMQGGKIIAVGAAGAVNIPAGAVKVDAKGMTVYPGLIDSETNLGLVEVESDRVNSDLVEESEEIFPQMHVYDAFHGETERLPVDRFNGVTNAVVAPASTDTMPGQDIFIQLAGRDRDAMIVAKDVALAMNFGQGQKRGQRGEGPAAPGPATNRFPSTRMGEISQLRQALLDAQEYLARRTDAAKTPAISATPITPPAVPSSRIATPPAAASGSTSTAPQADDAQGTATAVAGGGRRTGSAPSGKFDLRNEALIPYLKGEKPVILGAYEGYDVETAMALAQDFHLKVVLNHVTRSQEILDKIASYHVPVIVGPIYEAPGANQRYDAVYSLPAQLQKRGVKIALASYGVEFNRNLPYAAGYAVAFGLPYDEAMRSITLNPAEIWGVADKLGSLDVGKTANIVVANGDPLDVRTSVRQVYIDGVAIPMETRQTKLRDEYTPTK